MDQSNTVARGVNAEARKAGPYVLSQILGEGSYGIVQLGYHEVTRQYVAVKVISKERIKHGRAGMRVQREINVLRILNHPCVNKMIENFEDKDYVYVVLEYAAKGDLLRLLRRHGSVGLPHRRAFTVFWQVISGLQMCHSCCICHRDIKPENILIDEHGNVKLADFGMANMMHKNDHLVETSCGSPHYAAPEMWRGERYDGFQADMWSVGVLAYGLFAGKLPFRDAEIPRLVEKVLEAKFDFPSRFTDDIKSMLRGLICADAEKRFTMKDVQQHPFWLKWCAEYGLEPNAIHDGKPISMGEVESKPIPTEPVRAPQPERKARKFKVNESLLSVDCGQIVDVQELRNLYVSMQTFILQLHEQQTVLKNPSDIVKPLEPSLGVHPDEIQKPITGELNEKVLQCIMYTQNYFDKNALVSALRSETKCIEKAFYRLILHDVQERGIEALNWLQDESMRNGRTIQKSSAAATVRKSEGDLLQDDVFEKKKIAASGKKDDDDRKKRSFSSIFRARHGEKVQEAPKLEEAHDTHPKGPPRRNSSGFLDHDRVHLLFQRRAGSANTVFDGVK